MVIQSGNETEDNLKKIWSALLLLVLVLAAAGIASAETEIELNTPTAVEITIPRDVAVFEFTPETDGYYRFYSGPWDENTRNDTIGWIALKAYMPGQRIMWFIPNRENPGRSK